MGLGTALVTLAVAGLSVWAREGALAVAPRWLALALPVMELAVGEVIVALSLAVGGSIPSV